MEQITSLNFIFSFHLFGNLFLLKVGIYSRDKFIGGKNPADNFLTHKRKLSRSREKSLYLAFRIVEKSEMR